MTLGCGGYGGNITSDNISPRHLLNIKRLAYEIAPVSPSRPVPASAQPASLPKAATAPVPSGLPADALAKRIDAFLASRGFAVPGTTPAGKHENLATPPRVETQTAVPAAATPPSAPAPPVQPTSKPLDFVCEDDVRQALRQGRKLVIGERTIVTPAARDFGEAHRLFVMSEWPR